MALCDAGAEVVLRAEVTGLEVHDDRVTGVHWDGGTRDADLVVLSIGVRPGRYAAASTTAGRRAGPGHAGDRGDHRERL